MESAVFHPGKEGCGFGVAPCRSEREQSEEAHAPREFNAGEATSRTEHGRRHKLDFPGKWDCCASHGHEGAGYFLLYFLIGGFISRWHI